MYTLQAAQGCSGKEIESYGNGNGIAGQPEDERIVEARKDRRLTGAKANALEKNWRP